MKKRILQLLIPAILCVLVLAACAGQDGTTGKPDPSTTAGRPDPTTTGTRPHEHVFGDWTIVTAATCTADGLKERVCTCGEKESEVIAATGHGAAEVRDAKTATCTAEGYTGDTYCTVCDEKLETGAAIPATEHVFGDWTITTEATCTADGLKERTCTCGEKESEVIAATGHDYQGGICSACGEKAPSEGLKFTLNDDAQSYCVSAIGTCTDTDIVIPSVHDGLPVTSIGDYAFYYCRSLTSVTIGNSVTSIGDYAFYYCRSLTSIVIPDSVTSIGDYAFYGCGNLTSVTIGNGVTSIGNYAFDDCSSLTSVTIGNGVTSIGSSAFKYCYKLIEVYNLSTLNITAGSEYYGGVGYYAKNVYTATEGATKLFTDSDGYIFYEDGDTCYLMGYTGSETALTLSASCHGKNYEIYQYAFDDCSSLTSIVIPDSVTSIGPSAFYDCWSLTSITFTGTKAQWDAIFKGYGWNEDTGEYTIHCTDGDIEK